MPTPQSQPRRRVEYTQELRENIGQVMAGLADIKVTQAQLAAQQSRLEMSQNALAIQVATLPSRQEIATEFDKRVSSVAYQSDRKALEDRIERLEEAQSQTSQNGLAKVAIIVSTISFIATTMLGIINLVLK